MAVYKHAPGVRFPLVPPTRSVGYEEASSKAFLTQSGSSCMDAFAAFSKESFSEGVIRTRKTRSFASPLGSLGRPPEELCYGWVDPGTKQLVTVLNRPPVDSPATAVRAYIASR